MTDTASIDDQPITGMDHEIALAQIREIRRKAAGGTDRAVLVSIAAQLRAIARERPDLRSAAYGAARAVLRT